MKRSVFLKELISSIFVTVVLLYFIVNTKTQKIIIVPFLICSLSMAAQSVALLLNKEKIAIVFQRLFAMGFSLFYFGFFAIFSYLSIQDKDYILLICSIPFWLVGIWIAKNNLLRGKPKKNKQRKLPSQNEKND